MDITLYQACDPDGSLQVFDSNTPRFFAPNEWETFETFLITLPGLFWVARDARSGAVIGCGGVNLGNDDRFTPIALAPAHYRAR